MFTILYLFGDYALLLLRLTLGAILVAHGWPKLKNLRGTGGWLAGAGFRPGILWAIVLAVVEFFGGLALIAGFGLQFAAVLVAGEFLIINIWKIARREPFKTSVVGGFASGWEFDLLILASALALVALGAGAYSSGL